MNAVTEKTPLDQADIGLCDKFKVVRTDGSTEPGGKHDGHQYFPLNLSTDKHALPAIAAYADSCAAAYPALANDLRAILAGDAIKNSLFITVPARILPNGTEVPSFKVAQYLASRSAAGIPQSTAEGTPWVEIDYADAAAACKSAGGNLITETQWLSLALDISEQPENWTSGVVGKGSMFQGLHEGTVDEVQPGTYQPESENERRWFALSTGDRIYDFAGNAYSWVFDDIQGDETGIVARAFAADSPSIASAPAGSGEHGVGYYPSAGTDWSGYALVRGGCWDSDGFAGAFRLYSYWPDYGNDYVGFRCTK